MTSKRESNSRIIPNVERAFKMLELLSKEPLGLRFADVCTHLSLAKSSAFVLLESLEALGYIEKNADGRYRATLRLFQLGSKVLSHLDIRATALPFMVALRDKSGFPVHLAMLDGSDVVYLEKVEGTGFVRFDTYIGKRAPVHLTAVGKAIAAFLPEQQVDEIIAARGLGGGTEKSASTPADFKSALQTVRKLGFSLDDEEEVLGVRCIGAPVRDNAGKVIASISIIAMHRELPAARFQEFTGMVIDTAQRISTAMGYTSIQTDS